MWEREKCLFIVTAMALEIFRLDGRVAQEPLKDNNTLDTPKYTAIENTEMKRGEAVSIAQRRKNSFTLLALAFF